MQIFRVVDESGNPIIGKNGPIFFAKQGERLITCDPPEEDNQGVICGQCIVVVDTINLGLGNGGVGVFHPNGEAAADTDGYLIFVNAATSTAH